MYRLAFGGAIVATVVAGVLAVPNATEEARAAEATPPNIVVIMTDDMRVDDLVALPKTQSLLGGANGANYTNAFVSLPLCCPSRATFLTGQYAHNTGVWDNDGAHGGWEAFQPLESQALPTWLDDIYSTVMLGKYLNRYGWESNPRHVPPGWDSWQALTGPSVWNYHDFDININGNITHIKDGYQTLNFTRRAVTQIRTRVPKAEPMFMWLSLLAPHNGSAGVSVPAEPKYKGTSKVGRPASPAFDEVEVGDKPPWIRSLPRLSSAAEDGVVKLRRQRRDALKSVDDSVSQVIAALKDAKELSNTLIIFTTDNGFLLGEHRVDHNKQYPYEESIGVPLLIRGPGVAPGVRRDPVLNVDLAATIADAAGVEPGLPVDGMSMLNPIPADRPLLIEHPKGWAMGNLPPYSGVKQGQWVYVDYGQTGELYNLADDPWQQVNRFGDPSLAQTRSDLASVLDGLRDCSGDGCR
jgi:N-acetylglucosamine-6-sulfatase